MVAREQTEQRARYDRAPDERLKPLQSVPFILVHLAPLGALWTGVNASDVVLCVLLFWVRMFFITAGYHRYFSHRAFKTSRLMQFVFAFGGGTATQKGALWWAAHHRHHHIHSDGPDDVHSPKKGFWWSHIGWIMCDKYNETKYGDIKDMSKYPELVFLNEHHWVPPTILGVGCYLLGGWSALWIGFFLSTVLTYHGTFLINSATHIYGRRRFATTDTSRNSLLMALITFGEGWHNNHHHYQSSANMGFYWWEIDISYYVLRSMAALGLVWDLRRPPQAALATNLIKDGHADLAMLPWQEPSST
jgi:stearoyl-CoA desaturase (delta-9 desaturase)